MSLWKRKRPVPPRPDAHPLLGAAHLHDEYNSWFYRLHSWDGNSYQAIWADQADAYADIIDRVLAENKQKQAVRKHARDALAQIQEWHATVAERVNRDGETVERTGVREGRAVTVNELIEKLSALSPEDRSLTICAHTGSWDQGRGEVRDVWPCGDDPKDYRSMFDPEGKFFMIHAREW